MNDKSKFPRVALTVIALVVLSACSPDQQTAMGGTRAWIDVPRDQSVISRKSHEVVAHASDAAGLQRVTLLVNGVAIGMNCEGLTRPLVTCRANWDPAAPGVYRLEASATSAKGVVGTSKPAFVTVREKADPPTPAGPVRGSTDVATSTNVPRTPTRASPTLASVTPYLRDATITPSSTPTRTSTPTPTNTSAPVCPGAPIISSFTVSAGSITRGGSTTLSWGAVSNATSVEIDHGIGGVGTPGSRVVSPAATTTFTLTARGCGGTATRQVTILVTVPPTATFTPTRTPTVHLPSAPSNVRQVSRACALPDQIRVAWNDNSNNETGFRIYRRIRANTTWTIWSLLATVSANTTQYTDASGFAKSDDVEYGVEAYNGGGASARPTLVVSECID